MSELYNTLSSFYTMQGASYLGVADLTPVFYEVLRQGSEITQFPYAVVFDTVPQNSIVNLL